MADLGFRRGGGANSPGGRQHTISPKYPKNCMKLKEFGPGGAHPKFYYVDPPCYIHRSRSTKILDARQFSSFPCSFRRNLAK